MIPLLIAFLTLSTPAGGDIPAPALEPREIAYTGPQDVFQACRARVLRGDYGKQPQWKLDIYRKAAGVRANRLAKVTSYGPWESDAMSGGPFSWLKNGTRVRLNEAHCAANPEIPEGSIVWTDYGLRFVVDRGGWVKLGYVRGVGRVTSAEESANLDYRTERRMKTLRRTPYVILRWGW
jgi:hypothetical protein